MIKTLIIVMALLSLLSCSPNSPNENARNENSLAEYDTSAIKPQGQPFLCDDKVTSDGAKKALSLCLEQAQAGNVHAQARLGVLYASGVLGEKDWITAMNWFLLAAKLGHPEAQYIVAESYQLGRGIDRNEREAFYWYHKAAQANNVNAQTQLGMFYLQGQGVTQDFTLALEWLKKAVEQGDALAQYQLGSLFLEGRGIKQDLVTAESLFTLASEKDYPFAFIKLGDIYRLGLNGKPNPRTAAYWYEKGINKQIKEVQYHVAKLILQGEWQANYNPILLLDTSAQQEYKPAQLELAKQYKQGIHTVFSERLAFQWYLQASTGVDAQLEAQYEVGMGYIKGNSQQTQNIELGANYLKKAAQQNYAPAKYALASLYVDGYPVLTDKYQAVDYLSEMANQGVVDAQIKLAKVLIEFSLPQYDKAAFYWAMKAGNKDNVEGQYLLACFYLTGIGTEVDYKHAFGLFSNLAAKNHHLSQLKLGQMYYYGQGVEKDIYQAKNFFLNSAQGGVSEAKNWIAILAKEKESLDWFDYSPEIKNNSQSLEISRSHTGEMMDEDN